MAARNPSGIRNVTLAGQGGCGKTLLVERILFTNGDITRMGSIEDKNTVCDWTEESKKHHHSLCATPVFLERAGTLINLIDTPGLGDFLGHAIASLPACDTCAIVIDAAKGVETSTRRINAVAVERNLPRIIIINKIDEHNLDLPAVVARVRDAFGSGCLPINLPAEGGSKVINVFEDGAAGQPDFSSVPEAHTQILEQVVEVNEELMNEYLESGGEGLDKAKVHAAFEQALREGHLVPICFTSAKTGAGVEDLLNVILHHCPSPLEGNPRPFVLRGPDGTETPIRPEPDPAKPLIAHVFKVSSDPFVGKVGVFRVHQGTIRSKGEVYVNDGRKPVRVGALFKLKGKEQVEVDALGPGDIGAVAKVEEVGFNAVLHSEAGKDIRLTKLPIPRPMFGLAVTLKNHKDESKFGPATQKLMAEDPTFIVERVEATRQTVARGMGELHLRVILEKLKEQFNIDVETATPKVAYKETITSKAEGHHRHKKQTGGSGEFGEVYLRVLPLPTDGEATFEFDNAVVGGSIPKNFMPAIEKGIRQALAEGAVAGYPMTGIRVEVFDGKHHPVDSKETAFIKAGKRAFIDGVLKAHPALLEPIVNLEVTVPSKYMGDITGDLSTKRGRVQDTEMLGEDMCIIRAQAPLSELQNYSNELKSMTGGAGSFTMEYSHDEQTPPHIQQEVIAAYKPRSEED